MEGNVLFPVFLKLDQLHILLVGGGYVGLEKLEAILRNSPEAKVTICAKMQRPNRILLLNNGQSRKKDEHAWPEYQYQ